MKHLKLHLSILLGILLICPSTFAQKEIVVKDLLISKLYPVSEPLMLDSLDVNKKAYDIKNLLQTNIDFADVRTSKESLYAKNDSTFTLPFVTYDSKAAHLDKAIQLLKFNIDADRFCKASLTITTTDRIEVYVDGKKERTKDTKQDSLSKAVPVTLDLNLEPQRYEVIIKRLAQVQNFDEAALKITLKADEKYADAQIEVSTQGKRRITINDILEGTRLTGCSLSPSGKYYVVGTKTVWPGNKNQETLLLKELNTNRTVCNLPSGGNLHWLNKEDKLIISKDGMSDKDLYLFDPATMTETCIGHNLKFDYYLVAPNNEFLLMVRREEIPADKGNLTRTLSPSDRSGGFRNRDVMYLYSIKDELLQQITYGRSDIRINDISPDSKKLLLTSSEEIIERPLSTTTLFELDLTTFALDTLLVDNFMSGAKYSPDGKYLLINGSAEAFDGIGLDIAEGQISNLYDTQTYLYNLKDKSMACLTKNFNPSVLGTQWSEYDNHLYFRAEDKDRNIIYRYDFKSETFTLLPLPEDIISSFQLADNSSVALFRGESQSNAYRLYSLDLKTNKTTLLADPFKEQLDELDLPPVDDWSFKASNGSTIEGRYYLPYQYDPTKQYPMIVYYYGGTSPTTRIFESTYPLHTYAALGYVVLALNPSGTTGYGQEFSARHVNAWGKLTADEIIEGTRKFCDEHSFVNASKIGCIGASYGGFMTQYLLTQTDLFAAGISHAGISNIASYWGEGYWGYAYSVGASAYSYPWNNRDLYVEQSPLFHADKVNTPLLLLHGSADTNVPIGESIQMFNALRLLGKEVEFIQVAGENHAIYEYKKRIEWNKTIHAWFAKWLKDEPEWWETLYPTR